MCFHLPALLISKKSLFRHQMAAEFFRPDYRDIKIPYAKNFLIGTLLKVKFHS